MTSFRDKHPNFGKSNNSDLSIEQRLEESHKIKDKYPDRIPIICEKSASSKLPNVDKSK